MIEKGQGNAFVFGCVFTSSLSFSHFLISFQGLTDNRVRMATWWRAQQDWRQRGVFGPRGVLQQEKKNRGGIEAETRVRGGRDTREERARERKQPRGEEHDVRATKLATSWRRGRGTTEEKQPIDKGGEQSSSWEESEFSRERQRETESGWKRNGATKETKRTKRSEDVEQYI